MQRNVVVAEDSTSSFRNELADAQSPGSRPDVGDQPARVAPPYAVALLINAQVGVADHVQQHTVSRPELGATLGVVSGKIFRAKEDTVMVLENELLAVEQHEVDAILPR